MFFRHGDYPHSDIVFRHNIGESVNVKNRLAAYNLPDFAGISIKSGNDIYIGNLKKGESHTYTIGFTVYESQLDKACLTISNEPDNADQDKYGNDYDLTYYTRVR